MRSSYFDAETRSIVSLTESESAYPEWVINRVSVLPPHRGQGLARKLMTEVLFDADIEGVILQLVVAPDGSGTGLSFDALENWYTRLGFQTVDLSYNLMVRYPRVRNSLAQV